MLGEGETVNASAITLWTDASISGVVLDEGGAPIVGARVRALRQTPPRGGEFGGESWTTTDEQERPATFRRARVLRISRAQLLRQH